MARVHDLGGRLGFGAVPVHDDAVFAHPWERRAFGVTQFAQAVAGFNTDAFRHGIERERPDIYASAAYFDKWIRNAERMLVEGGVIGADAVTALIEGSDATNTATRTTNVSRPSARGASRSIDDPPQFAIGDPVQAIATSDPSRHSRVPSYVHAATGRVAAINGSWVLPDTNAHGEGERPCWVYGVRYAAAELWPDDAVDHVVYVDIFEPCLRGAS